LDCLYNSTSRKYTPRGCVLVVQNKGYKCSSDHCSVKRVSFVPTFQDYYILLLFLYQSYKTTRLMTFRSARISGITYFECFCSYCHCTHMEYLQRVSILIVFLTIKIILILYYRPIWSGETGKISPPQEFDPRTVQPVSE
jgi:hypothetical protein